MVKLVLRKQAMKTHFILPEEIRLEVESTLRENEAKALSVYAAAEKIRQRWEAKNVALEDIVELLVEGSGRHGVAIAFNPEEAKLALLGTTEHESAESRSSCLHSRGVTRGASA
jgi:hypothetical protein